MNAGSIMKITFENVKVTYMGKSVPYNGVRYVTNIGGGLPYDGTKDTVRHKVRVNATATFSDNTVFTWWAARKNEYIKSLKCRVNGAHL